MKVSSSVVGRLVDNFISHSPFNLSSQLHLATAVHFCPFLRLLSVSDNHGFVLPNVVCFLHLFPLSPTLLRLPVVLLQNVCSFLSPRELLVTLAQTAKTTRDLLTPACFSLHSLQLGDRELSLLSSLPSPSLTLTSFHSRLLPDCHLSIDVGGHDCCMQQVLDSLNHFPACKKLAVHGTGGTGWKQLKDNELYTLLRHPATLACAHLELSSLVRLRAQSVWMNEQQPHAQMRVTGQVKRRTLHSSPTCLSRQRPFDWSDIRLPSLTRLGVIVDGEPMV